MNRVRKVIAYILRGPDANSNRVRYYGYGYWDTPSKDESFYGYPYDSINDQSDGCTGTPELDSPH